VSPSISRLMNGPSDATAGADPMNLLIERAARSAG
jgi:hypothetical protein